MRKYFFQISTIIMVSILSLAYVACGDSGNSNGGGGGGGGDDGIVGVWTGQSGRRTYSFTFNGNGTGVIVEQYNDSYSGTETETETFSYVLTGENKGTITYKTYDSYSGYSTEVMYFDIQNNQMTISEDEQGRYPWITLSKAGAPNTNNVVGTWKGGKGRYNYTFTFNAGGTGSFVEQYYDSYSGTETDTETFNYSLTGNNNGTITIRVYDSYSGYSTEVFYFYIENNTMSVYEGVNKTGLLTTLTKQ
jgi:hypothetical protein